MLNSPVGGGEKGDFLRLFRVLRGRAYFRAKLAVITVLAFSATELPAFPSSLRFALLQDSEKGTQESSTPQSTPAVQDSNAAPQNPSTQQPAPKPDVGPPALTIPRLPRPPALDDFLSMKPQGEIALQMAKVSGFTQRNPHDGEGVSEPTDAYLGYDQKNLYVVFVCFDDPRKVRARMSRREDIYDDDQVEIMLDTFHDRRRAYAFQTTPLGVQWDAIWTEASREEQINGHFDTSFDTVGTRAAR